MQGVRTPPFRLKFYINAPLLTWSVALSTPPYFKFLDQALLCSTIGRLLYTISCALGGRDNYFVMFVCYCLPGNQLFALQCSRLILSISLLHDNTSPKLYVSLANLTCGFYSGFLAIKLCMNALVNPREKKCWEGSYAWRPQRNVIIHPIYSYLAYCKN